MAAWRASSPTQEAHTPAIAAVSWLTAPSAASTPARSRVCRDSRPRANAVITADIWLRQPKRKLSGEGHRRAVGDVRADLSGKALGEGLDPDGEVRGRRAKREDAAPAGLGHRITEIGPEHGELAGRHSEEGVGQAGGRRSLAGTLVDEPVDLLLGAPRGLQRPCGRWEVPLADHPQDSCEDRGVGVFPVSPVGVQECGVEDQPVEEQLGPTRARSGSVGLGDSGRPGEDRVAPAGVGGQVFVDHQNAVRNVRSVVGDLAPQVLQDVPAPGAAGPLCDRGQQGLPKLRMGAPDEPGTRHRLVQEEAEGEVERRHPIDPHLQRGWPGIRNRVGQTLVAQPALEFRPAGR